MSEPERYWWNGAQVAIVTRAAETDGGLSVLEWGFPHAGFGPPLHVHAREDESMYVVEGRIRFRIGDEELVAGPGEWVWQRRGVPHGFALESDTAKALSVFTPGGIEQLFADGGVPDDGSGPPPEPDTDFEAAAALASSYGFEIVGPPLGEH